MQTQALKDASKKEMEAVREAINQHTEASQEVGVSAVDNTAPLRTRLERAIEVMQEGLVERDTEARPLLVTSCYCCQHMLCHAYAMSHAERLDCVQCSQLLLKLLFNLDDACKFFLQVFFIEMLVLRSTLGALQNTCLHA